MIEINLMPKRKKEERLLSFLLLVAFIAVNFILLIILDSSLQLQETIKGKEDLLHQLTRQEEGLKQELIQAGKKVSLGGANPKEFISFIEKVRLQVPAVLDELSKNLPTGGKILSLQYAYPGQIQMRVAFAKVEDAALYLNRLRHLSFAAPQVLLQSVNRQGGAILSTPPSTAPDTTPATTSAIYEASYTIPIKMKGSILSALGAKQEAKGGETDAGKK